MLNPYIENLRNSNQQRLVFALLLPTIIMVFTALILAGFTYFLGLNTIYWGLPIAASMLIGNFILIYILKLNYRDLGLEFHREKLYLHIFGFLLLIVYSIITLALAGIKNFSVITNEGLYNVFFFTIAALSDELYFRGILYHLLEVWDEKTAFFGSSFIFGIWWIPVGELPLTLAFALTLPLPIPVSQLERILIGLSFCAIRYTSKMIFLTIPFHIILYIQNELIGQLIQHNQVQGVYVLWSYFLLCIVIAILVFVNYYSEKKSKEMNSKQG